MRLLALAAAALLASGCSSPSPNEPSSPVSAAVDGVTLLEAGAEPRRSLRELPSEAGSERRSMSLAISGEQVQGQLSGLTAAPPVLLEFELQRAAPEQGQADLTFVTGPFTLGSRELIAPSVVAAMEASLAGTSGHALSARVNRSGAIEDLQVQLSNEENVQVQQLAASYAQTLALSALRFPGEPVGVGARWSWSSSHRQTLGVLVQQQNTATLLEEAGGRLRLRMESVLTCERQRLSGAPFPEDMALDVTHLTGQGRAQLLLAADELLPIELDATGHWTLKLIVDKAGNADEVGMVQDMTLRLEVN